MADNLWLWKQECPRSSPEAFIFPNTDGGFLNTGNYRNRVLTPLAEKLGLPKLNFQVLRRTMATLAQKKGSVKDIQAHLRHAKADYHGRRVHAEPAGKRKADGRFCL